MAEKNQKSSAELKAIGDELSGKDVTNRLVDVERAGEEEVVALAEQLTTQMAKIFPGTDRSWMKLYKFMDDDQSGRISYAELKGMVRRRLMLSEVELPEARLDAIWKAIDLDDSGWISFGEFGRLMRRAAALKAQQAASKDMEDETSRRKRMVLEDRAARMLAAKVEEDKRLVAAARDTAATARQLEEDAARLELALKKGAIKGHKLRGQPSHARITPAAGDDQTNEVPPMPHPMLRPKKVGIGVDF